MGNEAGHSSALHAGGSYVFRISYRPHTIQAFLQTEYHVFGDAPFTLKIGDQNSVSAAAYKANDAESSVYVTARNPNSETLDDFTNADRQDSLRRELVERNLTFLEGEGKHPSSERPGEASFLIFGIDLKTASDLSKRMQQDAFVWSGPGYVPELILLR